MQKNQKNKIYKKILWIFFVSFILSFGFLYFSRWGNQEDNRGLAEILVIRI